MLQGCQYESDASHEQVEEDQTLEDEKKKKILVNHMNHLEVDAAEHCLLTEFMDQVVMK